MATLLRCPCSASDLAGKTDHKSESMKPAPTAQAPDGKVDHKLNAPQKSESMKPTPTAGA
jgi:hypothetical protein